jgi:AbrB family transcriptional regulator, transcriptional pleiotropic regulator of transition state genes
MKSTGVVRKLDNLGRIVIPIELRKTLGIEIGNGMEIFTEDDRIILRKYAPGCVFCGDAGSGLETYGGKPVCPVCAAKISLRQTDGGRA